MYRRNKLGQFARKSITPFIIAFIILAGTTYYFHASAVEPEVYEVEIEERTHAEILGETLSERLQVLIDAAEAKKDADARYIIANDEYNKVLEAINRYGQGI